MSALPLLAATRESARIADAITLGYGLSAAAVLAAAALLAVLAARSGGLPVNVRSWRFLLGLAALAAAIVVAIVGYLEVSAEPAVNRQIPYLASAGTAIVILAVAGGSLLVAEQLRADERRLAELEDAVRSLADAVASAIEAPARRSEPG